MDLRAGFVADGVVYGKYMGNNVNIKEIFIDV
jgi:hypothetical protein